MTIFDKIGEFHVKYGLEYTNGPRHLDPEMAKFRIKCLQEEVREYIEAIIDGNLAEQADALGDLIVFALGTGYISGFPMDRILDEIMRTNLQKERALRPEQSKRGSTYDIVKPAGWQPPDIQGLLDQAADYLVAAE